MKYCPRRGKAGVEGMKFCPHCGQGLIGFDLEEKQEYVHQPEVPPNKRRWFERHLNWTMGLAWIICALLATFFASGAEFAISWGLLSHGVVLSIVSFMFVAFMWWATLWAIKQKGRSPLHVLWLLVPFGFIVLLCLGNKRLAHDTSSDSIASYSKAIELNPSNAAAYFKRGDAYDELGEYEKAIADYNRTIELDPNHALAYLNRGCAYGELGEYEKAIPDYDKAIELRPNHTIAYYNRGYAYSEIGEYEKAIADYNKTIELDPGDADAYYKRGLAYHRKGEVPKAVTDLEKCIGLSTDPEPTKAAQQALRKAKKCL